MAGYPPSEGRATPAPSPPAPGMLEAGADPGALPVNELQTSVEISGLIQAIQRHGPVRTVQAHLQGLTKAEKALLVVDMFNLHQQQGEVLGVIVTHVWEKYVIPEKLWEYYEGGEHRFKEAIAYDDFVAPTLESAKASQKRKERHISCLESKWGAGWEKTIDAHTDHPSVLSEHYLRNMAKLASGGMALSDAGLVLQHVMKTRISHPGKGVRTQQIVMVSDIQKVVSATLTVSASYNIEPGQCSASQLIGFLDPPVAEAPRVTELDTPRTTRNVSPPVTLPPSRVRSFAVEIPARAPPQSLRQLERSVTPSDGPLAHYGLPSPGPTPPSKRSWSLPQRYQVDTPPVTIASPIDEDLDMSENESNRVLSPIASTPQSPNQSRGLTDASNSQLCSGPSLEEGGPSTQLVLAPSDLTPFRSSGAPGPHGCSPKDLGTEHASPGPPTIPRRLRSHSSSPDGILPALSPIGSRMSSPEPVASGVTSPVYHSYPPSPSPSAFSTNIPHLQAIVTNHDSPQAGPSESAGQSTGYPFSYPDLPPVGPMAGSAGLASNSSSLMPPIQLTSRKRHQIEFIPGSNRISRPYFFKLPDNWADCSPVKASIHQRGFYTDTDLPQFTDVCCHATILNELNVYHRFDKPSDRVRLSNCFYSLAQQALVQSPYVYLMALAAMGTTNHRLISLPAPLIAFPSSHDSELMDTSFPFAKYIASKKEVPGARLLCPLNNVTLRIGTSLCTKKEVKEWWDTSGGDLGVAASHLPLEHFSTAQLRAGELIAMPPQLLWSAQAHVPKSSSSSAPTVLSKLAEVRYIAVMPNGRLDFDYWPLGTLDQISHFNRDLRPPTVTGWGTEYPIREKRFRAAIEMRGVWAIGDALLGLMSWRSPLVQLELRQLFDAPAGDWFNRGFAAQIQTRLDEKLASMVNTLELVHRRAFGTAR